MQGGDRRLQREGPGPPRSASSTSGSAFGDLPLIPAAAVLLFQNNQIAGLIETGRAPRIVQQHEGQQAGRLGRRLRRISVLTRRPSRMASAHRSVRTSARREWPHSLR